MNIITSRLMPQIAPQLATSAPPTQDQASAFHQLLYAGTSMTSPDQMLVKQLDTLNMAVGVDLGAKIAGSVSQSINKLVNMA